MRIDLSASIKKWHLKVIYRKDDTKMVDLIANTHTVFQWPGLRYYTMQSALYDPFLTQLVNTVTHMNISKLLDKGKSKAWC